MKLKPIITEKSIIEAKGGKYTFVVGTGLTKHEIKRLIGEAFGVVVKDVKTMTRKGYEKRSASGRKRKVSPVKKAIVQLDGKSKIDIFEVEK